MRTRYETTFPRAALALLVGAAVGTCLVLGGMLTIAIIGSISSHGSFAQLPAGLTIVLILTAVVAFGAFGLGLLVLGAPAWWLLHRFGFRGRGTAIALGAILTFAVIAAPGFNQEIWPKPQVQSGKGHPDNVINAEREESQRGWRGTFVFAAALSIAGGIVGYAVWRVAYRSGNPAR